MGSFPKTGLSDQQTRKCYWSRWQNTIAKNGNHEFEELLASCEINGNCIQNICMFALLYQLHLFLYCSKWATLHKISAELTRWSEWRTSDSHNNWSRETNWSVEIQEFSPVDSQTICQRVVQTTSKTAGNKPLQPSKSFVWKRSTVA